MTHLLPDLKQAHLMCNMASGSPHFCPCTRCTALLLLAKLVHSISAIRCGLSVQILHLLGVEEQHR